MSVRCLSVEHNAVHEFSYAIPGSIKELLGLLADRRGLAKILAGGTDLIVQMRSGAVTPALLSNRKVPAVSTAALMVCVRRMCFISSLFFSGCDSVESG